MSKRNLNAPEHILDNTVFYSNLAVPQCITHRAPNLTL